MSERKTTIQSALNKYKVKAIKVLVESMTGKKEHSNQAVNSATNILLILQGEVGE